MKYSYECIECGEITTRVRKIADRNDPVQCQCGGECKKVILQAPVISLDPISGDFVGATDKWIKHREQKMKKEKHNMQEHGTYTQAYIGNLQQS